MIWLVGASGMLGREVSEIFRASGIDWIGSDREVDITSRPALSEYIQNLQFNWIVNCAGYTAVDKAETEGNLAYAINAEGAKNLAELAAARDAPLLHISTDYVFDGKSTRPYREEDHAAPLNVYGTTKFAGELMVRENCSRSYIIRTAWLYGQGGTNFVDTILKLMSERENLQVVSDQRGSPTWVRDLAAAIAAIIRSGKDLYGTYHYTSAGDTTWYEYAREIHRLARAKGLLARDCIINPIESALFPSKARRPAFSILSKEKIVRTFGLEIPDWRKSLARFMEERVQRGSAA
jgi:dTDP-4-dehydrorhamnose reductase